MWGESLGEEAFFYQTGKIKINIQDKKLKTNPKTKFLIFWIINLFKANMNEC